MSARVTIKPKPVPKRKSKFNAGGVIQMNAPRVEETRNPNKNLEFLGRGQTQLYVDNALAAKNILTKTATSNDNMNESIQATIYRTQMVNPTANNKMLSKHRRICFDLDQE